MKVFRLFPLLGALLITLTFSNCFKELDDPSNTPPTQSGEALSFEITDSPVEDANVSGVFVTVTGIKVNGETISNFSGKTTINLMDYQNGKVKSLGKAFLKTGSYDDVRLVIDYDKDATGTSPGTYVLLQNGEKQALKNTADGSTEIVLSTKLAFDETLASSAVIDFDLRKAIRYTTTGTSTYEFVTSAELNAAVRIAAKKETGTISGKITDNFTLPDSKVVVYAYKKGTYTTTEKDPQGVSGIRFKNAVSSALVDENGNITLAFLEDGNYELHFVNYGDNNSDGKFEEKGALLLELAGGLDLNNLSLSASATLSLNITVIGIVPL